MARLNDTAAVTARPLEADESHTINVRKLEGGGGFMVRRSTYNSKTGHCKESEEVSEEPPTIRVEGRKARDAAGSEGLADTKRYLGEDV